MKIIPILIILILCSCSTYQQNATIEMIEKHDFLVTYSGNSGGKMMAHWPECQNNLCRNARLMAYAITVEFEHRKMLKTMSYVSNGLPDSVHYEP